MQATKERENPSKRMLVTKIGFERRTLMACRAPPFRAAVSNPEPEFTTVGGLGLDFPALHSATV